MKVCPACLMVLGTNVHCPRCLKTIERRKGTQVAEEGDSA